MNFEINVSLNGRHFFATDHRSLTNKDDVLRVLPVIRKKFPSAEGFNISLLEVQNVGTEVDIDENGNVFDIPVEDND